MVQGHPLRFSVALVATLAVEFSPAFAGNPDEYAVVGFAQQGKVFIFEVFGDFDPIGGGHSTFYFIDVERDGWLPKTPIAVIVDRDDPQLETTRLPEIRARGYAKAKDMIDSFGVLDTGYSLARQSFGQQGIDDHRLRWRQPLLGGLPELEKKTETLALTTFPAIGGSGCWEGMGLYEKPFGFSLAYNGSTIFRDEQIPRSRGCPQRYFLEEVRSDHDGGNRVAIIAVFEAAIEGWDRSFVAVPLQGTVD